MCSFPSVQPTADGTLWQVLPETLDTQKRAFPEQVTRVDLA